MRKLLIIATVALLAACTFDPDLTGKAYWPCDGDGLCPPDCECLEGQVCIHADGLEPKLCAWCPEGYTLCDMELPKEGCFRLLSNPDNCGYCRKACPDGRVCEYGACTERCREGLIECEGGCVDPQSDPQNCGKCGTTCGANQVCSMGKCEKTCPGETVDCDGACVDTWFDPAHCGGCDSPCRLSHATADCVEGACVIRNCLDCYADCDQLDQTGCEICPETDPNNCGACGVVCDNPPPPVCEGNDQRIYLDTGDCVSSQCEYSSSLKPCLYGCESSACIDDPCVGVSCNLHMHCEAGLCVCDELYGDCDTSLLNGCETYLNDIENCGECEFYCGPDSICSGGVCDCKYGFGNCNESWSDGCEEDVLNNSTHCGTCDFACTFPNDACCGGSCVDINTDRGNCGRCNLYCSGMTDCCLGTCTDTALDPENCGSCGNICSFPQDTCCWGACRDVITDADNCGECSNACAVNIPCHLGTCGASGVYCGDTTCDLWEQRCCYGAGGIGCYPTTSCTSRIFECDEDSDCGDAMYCCLINNTQYVTQCTVSCPTLVCSSDEYCALNDPQNLHCCSASFYGQLVNTCTPEICR